VTDEVEKQQYKTIFCTKTPHPSAKLTPSPQGEG
jgi:hypothetical protein